MGTEQPISASAAPPLDVRAQGSDRTLPAGPSYTIGRDPQSDIVINEDRVSWQHAVLKHDGGSWVLEDTGSTNGTYVRSARVTRIGRAPDNDVVIPDLSVSRHHAELRRVGESYQIADLDSHNGTFVNGQRVVAAPLTEGDILGIGPSTFRLSGAELQEFVDTGDIS